MAERRLIVRVQEACYTSGVHVDVPPNGDGFMAPFDSAGVALDIKGMFTRDEAAALCATTQRTLADG